MRRRAYWLLPDVPSARAVSRDLLEAGIDARRMHFMGREDCDLSGLHAASVLQTSDVLGSAEAGLVIGAAVGGVAGAFAAIGFPDPGEPPQWNLIPVLVLAGALFDAWTSSMIGISAPNRHLKRFAAEIAQGRILLVLDLPRGRAGAIEARLQALHPEARPGGCEPELPSFS
ncbi:DUF1269 domain-containing protein [Ramlibacter sp.]|uniref:DUF1269 domain-containing protein n=1 Tax=Ramlibacter sp. TaxID=1917967 RepID=UPI002D267447|nr:DUF1269 domain-containing protein [Ramlibacter sp.]HYD76211.1 DUF1269 domain-containing protein [Ramlibacter sp.]